MPPATNWYKSLNMTNKMLAALEAFKKQTEEAWVTMGDRMDNVERSCNEIL
uniref:Uncharacterized protein n=1 Tax=Nymphaea colorata TaxID=210225 RepID=A0A5K0Z4X1_9MAGN